MFPRPPARRSRNQSLGGSVFGLYSKIHPPHELLNPAAQVLNHNLIDLNYTYLGNPTRRSPKPSPGGSVFDL